MQEMTNLIEFYSRFSDEQSCRDYLETARWGDKIVCPKCGVVGEAYKYTDGRLYKCGSCRKQFTVRVGTIFEDSKLPLQKWFLAIYLATSLKKGISSIQLSKYLGITQKTAWFMLHRIRYAVEAKSYDKPLDGVVEIDETYMGGHQKGKRGRAVEGSNKEAVFGAVERGGNVKVLHVPNSRGEVLLPAVRANIAVGATIMSDQYTVYAPLKRIGYQHFVINHSLHFGVGTVHTNSIEGFWSHLKRGVNGIYHHVSPKHLQKYCSEYEYRYNTREMSDGERFNDYFASIHGKLSYKQLLAV